MSRGGDAQHERKKLRVQGYTGRLRIGQVWPRVDREWSLAMMFAQGWIVSKVLRWCLPKGGSRTKSCDDVCPRVDRKRSPAMRFAQGWIASEVLRWCLPKGRSRTKSCDDVCPRVDRERSPAMMFAQGWIARWLRDDCATILNQDRQIRARTDTMAVRGTAKGELRRGESVMTTDGNS